MLNLAYQKEVSRSCSKQTWPKVCLAVRKSCRTSRS